ncbi:hypothetical protein RJ640_007409 [Escallonia rubra]|uniref:Uncharacterized protein n=1 Tax=Escallonia rubra TaxID=112253 RepID=A0AA88U0U0_9ASTE|nr:hypothetical protein RJ640_007409 [Escallonia rubra]
MYLNVKKAHRLHKASFSFFSNLIDHCLSSKSLHFTKVIHAQLIKLGFNTNTFLGNRCLDLYSRVGTISDALQAFDDIANKNVFSWNIRLRVFVKSREIDSALKVFDEMPERDVVSWNTMISCYASIGLVDYAVEVFGSMLNDGVRPSGFTYSILVSSVTCARNGKEVHGSMIRNGINFHNVVVGNGLIDIYGKLGLLDYAFAVFLRMEELDVISWNSLILGCCRSGYDRLALKQFCSMIGMGHSPDGFTMSTAITACTNLRDLDKGKLVACLCIKLGFLSNTIVSSSVIDLFSKCNRVEDSVRIFEERDVWDSAVCNSMMSSYAWHALEENALQTFVLALRENLRPTEFTLSCVVSCASVFCPVEQGSQLHSLVVKLGFESDSIVASSLVEMYCKYGSIDYAMNIFAEITERDLISWNSMIAGLGYNGKVVESLDLFRKLLEKGQPPDEITLAGVLLACNYGGFIDEGMLIFSSMEKGYGIPPRNEHYTCVVDMMSRAGKLKEALDIIEKMPCEPSSEIWRAIIHACEVHGDLKVTERVAEKMMELEPNSSLPYLVLAKEYELRGRWESLVRVRKAMKEGNVKKVVGCSWVGIKACVFVFGPDQVLDLGGKDIYSILRLLMHDMDDEACACQPSSEVERDG